MTPLPPEIALRIGLAARMIPDMDARGLLAILDNRILRKQYGRLFLESLPPYRVTSDLGEVRRFFSEE